MTLLGHNSSGWANLSLPNRSDASGGGSGPEAVIVPAVFGLIFAVGIVGNSLVMVVIARVKYRGKGGGARSTSPTNIFIVNLSLADLIFLIFCVPLHATIYSLPDWRFGAFLCSFGHFFSSVSMLVSIFTLAAMSVDRYVAVVRSTKSACARSSRSALLEVLFHLNKKLKNKSKKSAHSKRKTAQTVLLVVTAFTICWMPHHIIAMWVEFGTFPLNDASFVFRIVSHCLSYGNSCINPILYAFLSEKFRNACRQVFNCKLSYKPSPKGTMKHFHMENLSTTHSTTI